MRSPPRALQVLLSCTILFILTCDAPLELDPTEEVASLSQMKALPIEGRVTVLITELFKNRRDKTTALRLWGAVKGRGKGHEEASKAALTELVALTLAKLAEGELNDPFGGSTTTEEGVSIFVDELFDFLGLDPPEIPVEVLELAEDENAGVGIVDSDGGEVRLFDLSNDPAARVDLAADEPARAARMKDLVLRTRARLAPERPTRKRRAGEATMNLLREAGYAGAEDEEEGDEH